MWIQVGSCIRITESIRWTYRGQRPSCCPHSLNCVWDQQNKQLLWTDNLWQWTSCFYYCLCNIEFQWMQEVNAHTFYVSSNLSHRALVAWFMKELDGVQIYIKQIYNCHSISFFNGKWRLTVKHLSEQIPPIQEFDTRVSSAPQGGLLEGMEERRQTFLIKPPFIDKSDTPLERILTNGHVRVQSLLWFLSFGYNTAHAAWQER